MSHACKIYLDTGEVPLECLFKCKHPESCRAGEAGDDDPRHEERPGLKCKRCGSTDVRWRMQGGKWTLFSLQPGVLHRCQRISAQEDFK